MRVSALLVVVSALCAGCEVSSRPEPPPRAPTVEPADDWPEGIRLATLSTLGDLPPASDGTVIAIEPDGRLTANGEECTLLSLGALMRARRVGKVEAPPGPSAVLAIHEDVPWRVTQWVLQACASAELDRIFFAARTQGDETAGAFAVFLPRDIGVMPVPERRAEVDVRTARVRVRPGDESARDPWRLSLPIGDLASEPGPLSVEVDARGEVPTGAVLAVLDVLHRAGADDVRLVGTPRPAGRTIRAEVAAAGRPRSWGVELVGHELAASAPSPPPGRRVRGFAGFTEPLARVPEEELDELLPEVEIEDGEGR